jgi:signal transduction histidine kinase
VIARRIAKPLGQVAGVAREIGEGNLAARVELDPRHRVGEIRVLSNAINEMASRIQKQLQDQRELLAAVSHELRTPLGHLRILLELARDGGTDPKLVDELEKEILEVDDLVGELLASSRLSFDTLSIRTVEGLDIGARALERVGLPLDLLASDDDVVAFPGDATLLGRALANLLENAKRYGEGVVKLEVAQKALPEGSREVVFTVVDRGRGFDDKEIARVFDPFYRGEHRAGAAHQSLGLGLSLVSRIAQAHGGRAWAQNVVVDGEVKGARVSFSVLSRPDELPANRPPALRDAAE